MEARNRARWAGEALGLSRLQARVQAFEANEARVPVAKSLKADSGRSQRGAGETPEGER